MEFIFPSLWTVRLFQTLLHVTFAWNGKTYKCMAVYCLYGCIFFDVSFWVFSCFILCLSVLLRQNPHNVHEWHKRVKLYEGKPKEIINTYTEAVQTVEPKLASGKPHTLWVEFAKFYEQHGQLAEARVIFDKATKVNYRKVDDLASVWCEFSEMEIRHE